MALTELETRRVAKALDELVSRKRPPAHLRDQLDFRWSLEGQSVYLIEVRRLMDGERHERPFAKATWVRTQNVWKIYWQRADLKWHSYEPVASVKSIQGFCDAVKTTLTDAFGGSQRIRLAPAPCDAPLLTT